MKIVQLYQFMIYHLFSWTSTVHTSFCVLKLAYHFDDIFFSVCTFLFFIFLFVLLISPVFIHRQLTDCCRTYLHCGTGETTRISCGVNGMARRKKNSTVYRTSAYKTNVYMLYIRFYVAVARISIRKSEEIKVNHFESDSFYLVNRFFFRRRTLFLLLHFEFCRASFSSCCCMIM